MKTMKLLAAAVLIAVAGITMAAAAADKPQPEQPVFGRTLGPCIPPFC